MIDWFPVPGLIYHCHRWWGGLWKTFGIWRSCSWVCFYVSFIPLCMGGGGFISALLVSFIFLLLYSPLCCRQLGSASMRRGLTRKKGTNFILPSPVYSLGCTIWVSGGVGLFVGFSVTMGKNQKVSPLFNCLDFSSGCRDEWMGSEGFL